MTADFVHLHIHSEYSIADGIVRFAPLAAAATAQKLPALALTDLANVHGAIKFYRACLGAGVKPIIGCDVWVENPLPGGEAGRMILLCSDNTGWKNLGKLLTDAYLRSVADKGKTIIAWKDLAARHDGLLALFDDWEGPLTRLPGSDTAEAEAKLAAPLLGKYHEIFGDRLYFQVSRVGWHGEEEYLQRAARQAAIWGVGLVATNRVQFATADEFDAHEIRVCIHDGRKLQDPATPAKNLPRNNICATATR